MFNRILSSLCNIFFVLYLQLSMCCLWPQWARKTSEKPLSISTMICIGTRTLFMICTRLLQAENGVQGLSHQTQLLGAIYKFGVFFPSFNHTHECHSHWNMNAFLRHNMTRIKRTVSTKVFIIFLGLESTVLVVNSLEKSFYLKFQQCSYEIETENTAV